jgi:hypothetical protein
MNIFLLWTQALVAKRFVVNTFHCAIYIYKYVLFLKYFGMISISIFDIFEIEKCTIVQEVYKNIKWLSVYFHDPLIVIYRYMNGARVAQWVRSLDLTAHTSISPIRRGFAPSFVNYKKGCTRLTAASDKVYQLLAQSRWFSPGTPASSTTKTGCHDIAEILLKVALNTKLQIQIQIIGICCIISIL